MGKIWSYIKGNIWTLGVSTGVVIGVALYSLLSILNIIQLPDIFLIPVLSFLILLLMFIVIDTYENLKHARSITYYRNPAESLEVVTKMVHDALCESESKQTRVDILLANFEWSNPGRESLPYEDDIKKAIKDPDNRYEVFYRYLVAKRPEKEEWCKKIEEKLAHELPAGRFELRYTNKELTLPMFNMLLVPQLKKVYLGFGNDKNIYQGGILIVGDEIENFASKFYTYYSYIWNHFSTRYEPPQSETGGTHS